MTPLRLRLLADDAIVLAVAVALIVFPAIAVWRLW